MATESPQGSVGVVPLTLQIAAPSVGAGFHLIASVTCERLGVRGAMLMFEPAANDVVLSATDGTNVRVSLGLLVELLAAQLLASGTGASPEVH